MSTYEREVTDQSQGQGAVLINWSKCQTFFWKQLYGKDSPTDIR